MVFKEMRTMPKKYGKIRIWTEYAGVMLGYVLLAWLPAGMARVCACFMGDLWRMLDKRHRLLAMRQSMDRLGIDEGRARVLVRDNYRHYALFVMETARLRRMPSSEVVRRTRMNGCDRMMCDLLARGKGMILVTGHLGNWEWGAVILGMLDVVDGMIARPLDNPLIDRFVRGIRESTGASVWDKCGSMRKALSAVRKGRGVVAVMDQHGGSRGVSVPFLDKEGGTMSAPVELAIRTGAPLYVVAMVRDGVSGGFSMQPKRVHWPVTGTDPESEKVRLATAINADLSELIREFPEQWIWIHRRWRAFAAQAAVVSV